MKKSVFGTAYSTDPTINDRVATTKDKADDVWRASLRDMTNAERVEFLATLAGWFCKHCGTSYLPCSCWNDE